MTLDAYLGKMFLTPTKSGVHDFDVLIFYDRANGIRFPIKEMREIFMREVGLTSKPTKTAGIFRSSGVHDFDVLIFYDRANGIRFPIKEMREIFMREVGLTSKPTKTAGIFQ